MSEPIHILSPNGQGTEAAIAPAPSSGPIRGPWPDLFPKGAEYRFLRPLLPGGGGRNPYFLHKKSFSSRQGTHQAEGCQLEILKKESERLLLNFAD